MFQDLVTASIALEPGGLNYDLLIGRLNLLAFQKVVPNLLVRSENIDTNEAVRMHPYFLVCMDIFWASILTVTYTRDVMFKVSRP